MPREARGEGAKLTGYVVGSAGIAALTIAGHEVFGRDHPSDVLMLYMLPIILVSMRWSIGPAVSTAMASALAFDWFFIPPYRTLAVADPRHLVTFVVVVLIAVVINRLTERVRAQAAKAHAAERLVETERMRSSLLSSVSHDLRTPLAVITGTATTLADPRLEPEVRRDLIDTIVHEAGRLERLVRNLLDVTRVEGGALRLHKEWQPLEEVVGAALASAEHALGERAIATSLAGDVVAPFDAVLVHQVLVNLLENAARHTPAGSPIAVEASRSPSEIAIVVSDRGPGVPAGDEARIFDKFYRADKGKGGGAGLGLAICKGIVTAHGGRIWAENRADGGAAFHFTLPLDGEPPQDVAPDSPLATEGAPPQ